jgi:hypothetical protein
MNQAGDLTYDVFVNDPPPQDGYLGGWDGSWTGIRVVRWRR